MLFVCTMDAFIVFHSIVCSNHLLLNFRYNIKATWILTFCSFIVYKLSLQRWPHEQILSSLTGLGVPSKAATTESDFQSQTSCFLNQLWFFKSSSWRLQSYTISVRREFFQKTYTAHFLYSVIDIGLVYPTH